MTKQCVSYAVMCIALSAGSAEAQTGPVMSQPVSGSDVELAQSTSPAPVAGSESAISPPNSSASAGSNAGGGIEDIVVTAQRRSENLQRVPITVQAVTQQSLVASGAVNAATIQTVIPGLVIQRTFAGATPFLRGVGTTNSGFTSEMPVATYIDGVYLPNAASGVFAFNNIERIEVLKGPQGTLFGRNAVGGLIQIVTRDPKQTPHFEGSLGYGNYNTIDANLYATGGVSDNLAADFSLLYHDQNEGWGRNLTTGNEIFKNSEIGISSKLKWTPTDRTTVTLRGLYDHSTGDIGTGFGVYPGSRGIDGTPYFTKYTIANNVDPSNESSQANFGLKIEQDLDFARLVSITGFNHVRSEILTTQNGIPGQTVQGRSASILHNLGRSNTFTQEIQLLSDTNAPLQWITGAFFMRDHFTIDADVIPTCIGNVCAPSPIPIRTVGDQVLKSYAVFGEATLRLTSTTRLTAGLRYTRDKKDVSGAYRVPLAGYPTSVATLTGPNAFGQPGAIGPKASFSKITWRGVLAHDFTPTVMGYASVNRGFKAGAFNPVVFTNPVVQPEVMDAYETGLKSELFDRTLRFNISAFLYNYKNIQLRTTAPPALPGLPILYNAAKARIKGIDAEMIVAPTSGLTLNAAISLLDPKFESFPGGICTTPRVIAGAVLGGVATQPCVLDGKLLPRAPRFSGNFGVTYKTTTAIGDLALTASDSYNSGFFWDPDNRIRQRSYHQVNATLTWTSLSGHYNAQLYARNLNKPYFFNAAFEGAGGNDTYSPGEPRTYGIKFGFMF